MNTNMLLLWLCPILIFLYLELRKKKLNQEFIDSIQKQYQSLLVVQGDCAYGRKRFTGGYNLWMRKNHEGSLLFNENSIIFIVESDCFDFDYSSIEEYSFSEIQFLPNYCWLEIQVKVEEKMTKSILITIRKSLVQEITEILQPRLVS